MGTKGRLVAQVEVSVNHSVSESSQLIRWNNRYNSQIREGDLDDAVGWNVTPRFALFTIHMPLSRLSLRRNSSAFWQIGGAHMASRFIIVVVAIGLTGLLSSQALGQYPRYVPPAGRTLPNELNYFRRDVGLLDQYNGFVAPIRQLDSQLRNMQNQQRTDFQSAERAISQIRTSQAAPTGVGAGFMNYSHYYRLPTSPGR
jgi:hypothetical protein